MHRRLIYGALAVGLLGLLLLTVSDSLGGLSAAEARQIAIGVVTKRIEESPERKYTISVSLAPEMGYWRVHFFRLVEGNWHPDECWVYVHRHSGESFMLLGE